MKDIFNINQSFKRFLPIFLIMLSIMLLIGTSYALLRSADQGENTYVVNVGLLEVTFLDSEVNTLTLDNAVPMSDNEGISQTEELVFTVKNTGSVSAKYSVYIEETSINPEFKTVIKFISNKNNTGYNEPQILSEDNYIEMYTDLEVNETATYKVKAWLSDTLGGSTYMNKNFVARIVVDAEQEREPMLSLLLKAGISNSRCNSAIIEDEITYISGTKECIDFNYVWYSGKLWRITAINPDGTMKMITDDLITTISYGSDVNFYTDENTKSYMYQWLNEDFLDTLYNYENIIVTDSVWNATNSNKANVSTKLPETTLVTAPVGLLNSYEYYKSCQNKNRTNSYINNGYLWWLLNPYSSSNVWYVYDDGGAYGSDPSSDAYGVRPSINLQSGITISGGSGTSSDPYRINGDKEEAVAGTTLINTRTSGEYVTFNNELYRIVGFENGTTKINKNDYIRNESDTVITKKIASTVTYGASGNTQSNEYWDYYLNNTWYNNLSSESQNMLVDGTYYLGRTTDNYKGAICTTASNDVTTTNCEKTTITWTGKVGLLRYGEMFASQQGDGYSSSSATWLITPFSNSNNWLVSNYSLARDRKSSILRAARPTVHLKSSIKIIGGSGTKIDPYTIA